MKKKIISIVLIIVIIATSLAAGFYAFAKEREKEVNKELLESILNDRQWIVETLIDGNYENNPYSAANPSSSSQSIKDEALENYKNDKAFKALVDAMDVYANTGQYVSGFADDILTEFMKWFGSSDFSGATDTADKIVASTSELKYESILNEVLQTDYTSSWGDTLFDDSMNLENLQEKAKILKKLNTYQTSLIDSVGLNHSDSSNVVIYDPLDFDTSEYKLSIEDYTGHFLDSYGEDLEEYINNLTIDDSSSGNAALQKKINATAALGAVTLYERVILPETHLDLDDYYDGMYDDTMKILKNHSKKLAKGKKYYVRIRGYKKIGKRMYYSYWSSKKTVKVK